MPEQPPQQLVRLLRRLRLATPGEVLAATGRVRRLARDLPLFESVWVDALAQARLLTRFQAAEINAGRGEGLRVGPYLLCRPLASPGYAKCFLAREIKGSEPVRLYVVPVAADRQEETLGRLDELIGRCRRLRPGPLAPLFRAGGDGQNAWAAGPHVPGATAREWTVHNGRFPPEVVLDIARQTTAALAALQRAEIVHGDVSATGLVLTGAGQAVLLAPGLRGIVRPEEGYGLADLSPEDYDSLAPERIRDGSLPTVASDVFACGCLWWHLLAGRAPIPGGSALAKLRAMESAEVPDLRPIAPNTPPRLVEVIQACVRKVPEDRPASFRELAAKLGPSTRAGRASLAACVRRPGQRPLSWTATSRAVRQSRRTPAWLAVTVSLLIVAVAAVWTVRERMRPVAATGGTEPALADFDSSEAKPLADVASEPVAASGPDEPAQPVVQTGFDATNAVGRVSRPVGESARMPREAGQDGSGDPSYPDETGTRSVPATLAASGDLVLPAGGPVPLELLSELRPGQRVRGQPGERPKVIVPETGLTVGQEDVRLENVDFVWPGPKDAFARTSDESALVRVEAGRAEFHGCSFRSADGQPPPRAAIVWAHPVDRREYEAALPSGQLGLRDCVFSGVGTAVACRTLGAVSINLANVLHQGNGPLVTLNHCPRLDEPVGLSLTGVTLRQSGPLLDCRSGHVEAQPGHIAVQAVGCVLVPADGEPLLCFTGPESPERLLAGLVWTGQGSLAGLDVPIAAWRGDGGETQRLDDSSASIAGLVRSRVEFAGPSDEGLEGSQVVRWQVPLRSPQPPGIDPERLPRP